MSNQTTPTQPNPLTRETLMQMVQAYQRLNVLMNTAIKQPNDDAELVGQRTFLARAFLTHGAEFLNSWLMVADEYDPLVRGFASLQQRAANFAAMRQAQFEAAAKAGPTSLDSNSSGDGAQEPPADIIDADFKLV